MIYLINDPSSSKETKIEFWKGKCFLFHECTRFAKMPIYIYIYIVYTTPAIFYKYISNHSHGPKIFLELILYFYCLQSVAWQCVRLVTDVIHIHCPFEYQECFSPSPTHKTKTMFKWCNQCSKCPYSNLKYTRVHIYQNVLVSGIRWH